VFAKVNSYTKEEVAVLASSREEGAGGRKVEG